MVAKGEDTALLVANPRWARCGLDVKRITVHPPDAVRQREAAISASRGALLLMLDDDVELGTICIEEMLKALNENPGAVAVMADFSNQPWPMPTRVWRLYLRLVHRLKDGEWQGRVIGPLLRFAYNPLPSGVAPMEWLGKPVRVSFGSVLFKARLDFPGSFSIGPPATKTWISGSSCGAWGRFCCPARGREWLTTTTREDDFRRISRRRTTSSTVT